MPSPSGRVSTVGVELSSRAIAVSVCNAAIADNGCRRPYLRRLASVGCKARADVWFSCRAVARRLPPAAAAATVPVAQLLPATLPLRSVSAERLPQGLVSSLRAPRQSVARRAAPHVRAISNRVPAPSREFSRPTILPEYSEDLVPWGLTSKFPKNGSADMNSAKRLLVIYDKAMAGIPTGPLDGLWRNVFELSQGDHHAEDDVMKLLSVLRDEINLTTHQLATFGVDRDLYESPWSRFRQFASPALVHQAVEGHIGNVSPPEVRLGIAWSAWALRDLDEQEADATAYVDLMAHLNAADAALDGDKVPEHLRALGKEHLETLRAAFRVAGIRGAREVKAAVRKVVGEFAIGKREIDAEIAKAPAEGKSAFGKVADVVAEAAKYGDQLSKVKKGVTEVGELVSMVKVHVAPYAHQALEWLQRLRLPGPAS